MLGIATIAHNVIIMAQNVTVIEFTTHQLQLLCDQEERD